MEFAHVSVLLKETIEQLNIRPDGIYVDGTLPLRCVSGSLTGEDSLESTRMQMPLWQREND